MKSSVRPRRRIATRIIIIVIVTREIVWRTRRRSRPFGTSTGVYESGTSKAVQCLEENETNSNQFVL